MSHYTEVKTTYKDKECLLKALQEMKWDLTQIEVHKEATNLFGYRGDMRSQKANIIIRKKNVGSSSNDIGFLWNEKEKCYVSIISEYDESYKYGATWQKKLKMSYAIAKTEKELRRRRIPFKKQVLPSGVVRLRAVIR